MDKQDVFDKLKETLLKDKIAKEKGCKWAYGGIYMMCFQIKGFKHWIKIRGNNFLYVLKGKWLSSATVVALSDLTNLDVKGKIKEVKKALKLIKVLEGV